ncbi:MAG: YidC/Oxa1 family membrane protein insertase [Lachnospiraceae bacterium]|nr:YidC/Oxa1 family membrane protein insertase [Lachnospiraceae bacterium]
MYGVLLTQYDGKILGPVAKVLGYILNWVFIVLEKIGIPNIALSIILFTIVIYLLLTPLTIKQQKFSKLSAKMNPEIQAIQAKYKGKKDQASMAAMNEETQAVYKKYGVSPSGSCVQLVIQMPILFALYRVIYNVPAYVGSVKEAFVPFVNEFITKANALSFISNKDNFAVAAQLTKQFENEAFKLGADNTYVVNTFIDVLNRATTAEWMNISVKYPEIADICNKTYETVTRYNNFFGLNIANSPKYYVLDWKNSIGLAIGALLIPILSALTQWINTKLMPQAPQSNDDQASAMAASMKSMNIMMPIMSLVFVFSLPIGMGIYWIAGAVIRSVQQIFINKHIDKMDIDSIVAKNTEKLEKQIEKKSGVTGAALNSAARMSTRTISEKSKTGISDAEREEAVRKSTEYYNKGVKPGSLAAKANMVRQYNEKNNK